MCFPRKLLAAAFLIALLTVPATETVAAPFDGSPKVLLHLTNPVTKNVCNFGTLADCRTAVTAGNLDIGYFAYLLVARGDLPDVAGFECGINYEGGNPAGQSNHSGVDIFSWTLCGTLEFPTPSPVWPRPGSGNLIAWNTDTVCQTGETAVAGYFYLAAYSSDKLAVTLRPVSGAVTVTTCSAVDRPLDESDLGWLGFSAASAEPGCNPCVEPCIDDLPPICSVEPGVVDFGEVLPTGWVYREFTLTNAGGGMLVGNVTESHNNFRASGSFSLAAGNSKVFRIGFFAYTTPQSYEATIDLGPSCGTILARATGVLPPPSIQCNVSPQHFDFGVVPLGSSADKEFAVMNPGLVPFTTDLSINAPFSIVGPAVRTVLPGDTTIVVVRYTATAQGDYGTLLHVGIGQCPWVFVYATTYSASGCWIGNINMDFGDVETGQWRDKPFVLRNVGGPRITGTVQKDPLWHDAAFSIVGDPTYDLAAGEEKTFTVRFAPSSGGTFDALFDANGCYGRIYCHGYGFSSGPGLCSPDPRNLNFPHVAVGDSAYLPFLIFNSVGTQLVGTVSDTCADFYVAEPRSYNLPPGGMDTMLVVFKPTTSASQSCNIQVPGCYPVSCTGNTITVPLAVFPPQLEFGTVAPGDTVYRSFLLTNGGGAARSGQILEECPEFSVSGPGAYDLPAGASMPFLIAFHPSSTHAQSCNIQVAADVAVPCTGNEAPVRVRPVTWSAIKARFYR
jgi:hypothetical protein